MEYMGHGGVGRDHAVISNSSVVQKLDELADKAQAYRSEEQKYTDKRQATGYQLSGPVPFGTFEVGRGSMPGNDRNTAVFMDQMVRGINYPHPNGHTAVQVGE